MFLNKLIGPKLITEDYQCELAVAFLPALALVASCEQGWRAPRADAQRKAIFFFADVVAVLKRNSTARVCILVCEDGSAKPHLFTLETVHVAA